MLFNLMSLFLWSRVQENCLFHLQAGNRDKVQHQNCQLSLFKLKYFDFFFVLHPSIHNVQCIKPVAFWLRKMPNAWPEMPHIKDGRHGK